MSHVYDRKAPKQPANLSVNRDLLTAAREAGINLSDVLEEALAEKVAAARRELWARENSDAIAEYNEFTEQQGVVRQHKALLAMHCSSDDLLRILHAF